MPTESTWQDRLLEERWQLHERLARLNEFFNSYPVDHSLRYHDLALLVAQREAMRTYLSILDQRLQYLGHHFATRLYPPW